MSTLNFQQFLTEFEAGLGERKTPTAVAHWFVQLGTQGPDDPYCSFHGWKCLGHCPVPRTCDSFFNPVYNKRIHALLVKHKLIQPLRVVMKRDMGRNKIFTEDACLKVLLEHFVKSKPTDTWIEGEDDLLRDPFVERC